jgi:hypothetical protein
MRGLNIFEGSSTNPEELLSMMDDDELENESLGRDWCREIGSDCFRGWDSMEERRDEDWYAAALALAVLIRPILAVKVSTEFDA